MSASPSDFRNAFSLAAATVAVITTRGEAGLRGLTATSYASVSDSPPMLLVCIGGGASSLPAIEKNGLFCLNLLSHDMAETSDVFAGRRGFSAEEKFDHVEWVPGLCGQPVLSGALASLECRVTDIHPAATHKILIGTVENIVLGAGKSPLLYHGRKYQGLI